MSFFASLAIVLSVTTARAAPTAPGPDPPHPAVVRVIAPDSQGVSYGSGTLVGVWGQQGLVVTNWHVVRDATGQIEVVFPDGFRSAATVLATDSEWDLAALTIWRPAVEPVPLANGAPRPGDPLTIAGYGSGRYRAVTGRCTQYVAPGSRDPFEMVELSVAARQGDSGGPIFNVRGELAGVLFGSARGTTTGSYCGRVRWFLAKVSQPTPSPRLPEAANMLAAQPSSAAPAEPAGRPTEPPSYDLWTPPDVPPSDPTPVSRPLTAAIAASKPVDDAGSAGEESPHLPDDGWIASQPPEPCQGQPTRSQSGEPASPDVPTRFDQIKDILAVVGALAILLHGLRLLSSVQSS